MAASNIDRFDLLVAKIFADLYSSFPIAKDLSMSNYWEELVPGSPESTEGAKQQMDREEFFFSAVKWLESAGYIYSVSNRTGGKHTYFGACLTAKALQCLKSVPKSLFFKRSLGQQLRDAVQSGASDAMKSVMAKILGKGASLLYLAVSS